MKTKIVLSMIFLLSMSIYPQINREEALKQGGWSGGLAGWLGWENYDVSENNSTVDGYNFIFSSRNGSIVETNGVFGFDFQWREKHRTIKESNPAKLSETVKDKVWFIGLWARYYIPWGGNFAMFLEGSGGYAVFSKEYEIITDEYTSGSETFANGFAYNGGIGFSHFVSQNAAFELTGRWEGGSLNGDEDLNITLGNIFILFGFQIYLR
ncbi:MAG TPA: hypothetical protein VIZ21_02305 [Ignavibacteriaceae bacterium]